MVTIIDYSKRRSKDGAEFFALIVQGGVDVAVSRSGSTYAKSRKCSIPSIFDEQTCRSLIGNTMPGEVKRVACSPYSFTNSRTGEMEERKFRNQYVSEEEAPIRPVGSEKQNTTKESFF